MLCLGQVPAITAASRAIFDGQAAAHDLRIRIGIITGSIGAEERRNWSSVWRLKKDDLP